MRKKWIAHVLSRKSLNILPKKSVCSLSQRAFFATMQIKEADPLSAILFDAITQKSIVVRNSETDWRKPRYRVEYTIKRSIEGCDHPRRQMYRFVLGAKLRTEKKEKERRKKCQNQFLFDAGEALHAPKTTWFSEGMPAGIYIPRSAETSNWNCNKNYFIAN